MQGTSKGSSRSICARASTRPLRSAEPGAYALCPLSVFSLYMVTDAPTMGSLAISGTLNAASCGVVIVVRVERDMRR